MRKIGIIGPCFPWRGGIAHHTNEMIKGYLSLGIQVTIFTFSRQYPNFLYPGKDQIEPESISNPLSHSPGFSVYKIIDTINPFSWLKTIFTIFKEKPDYCLIKYWHPYFVPCFVFISFFLHIKGIKLVSVIDNLFPHEGHFGDRILASIFLKQMDAAITQSRTVHDQLMNFHPEIPEILIEHPVYEQFGKPQSMDYSRCKLRLQKNKVILLFFGFIRPYKGLDSLLQIMPRLITQIPNIHLLIAGECFGSFKYYQKIIDNLNLASYLTLHLSYIPSSDIPLYFGACDLLVMPYRSITNSGIENIAKVYANNYLLTVGLDGDQLSDQIITVLKKKKTIPPSLNFFDYCKKIDTFISSL